MASETYAVPQPGASTRPRAELLLAAVALVSLALIPIHITKIYSGLPAHPLFLHIPVILIPVATIGALALIARPQWFSRYGVALAALTVVALIGCLLTVGSGLALRSALHSNAPAGAGGFGGDPYIARHAHAASILRVLMIAFTAMVIVAVLAHRVAGGAATGQAGADRLLARRPTLVALRAILAALAIATGYFVFHTGDLGAKAVWAGRLSNRGRFGAPPGGFGTSSSGAGTSAGGARAPSGGAGTQQPPGAGAP